MRPRSRGLRLSHSSGASSRDITPIAVEVKAPTITHEPALKQIQQWLDGACNSPKGQGAQGPAAEETHRVVPPKRLGPATARSRHFGRAIFQ